MSKLYGMVGSMGSGKDTAATYLTQVHGWRRLSFAGPLKDALAAIFGWPRDLLEGHTAQSRWWRDQVDTWWAQRLGIPSLTPRWVLQYTGTDVLRKHFHNDIWIAALERQVTASLNSGVNVVISDCRFPNELEMIRNQGGKLIEVRRGACADTLPWAECAGRQNLESVSGLAELTQRGQVMEVLYPQVHPSEWSWVGLPVDQVIDNSGTVQQLHQVLDQFILNNH